MSIRRSILAFISLVLIAATLVYQIHYVPLSFGAETLIFNDTFTGADTTLLDAHTPDTGTSWTKVFNNEGDDDIAITSNQFAGEITDTSGGSAYTADATYSDADYIVEFTCTTLGAACGAGDDYVYPIIRSTGTLNAANGGYLMYDISTNVADDPILAVVSGAGTCTTLDTFDQGEALVSTTSRFIAGTNVKLQAVSNQLVGFSGEVGYLLAHNSAISSANKGGVGVGAHPCDVAGDSTATLGGDNFSVYQLADTITATSVPATTGEVSNQFTNASNAYASDNTYATEDTVGQFQDYGDFGLSSTFGSTIRGISVYVEANSQVSLRYTQITVEVSNDNGATWSDPLYGRYWQEDIVVFGSGRYLWGLSWNYDDIDNDNLRVRIGLSAEEISGANLNIDTVWVRAFYDAGTGDPPDTTKQLIVRDVTVTIRDETLFIIRN